MLSKCANPACSARFRYLHQGRIFNIEMDMLSSDSKGPSVHKIEHFWLCECCAQTLKVVLQDGVVATRPLRMELTEGAAEKMKRSVA